MMVDFELYTWDRQNAVAPIVFFEEVGVSYHLIPANPESKPVNKAIKKISPWGDIPVLVDCRDGKKRINLLGTASALFYLALETKKLMPTIPKLYTEALHWFFWQERALHGNILIYEATEDDKARTKCRASLKKGLKRLDTILKNREYIADEISIVDIAVFFLVRRPEEYGIWINNMPNLRDWIGRIGTRSSFQKARAIKFY